MSDWSLPQSEIHVWTAERTAEVKAILERVPAWKKRLLLSWPYDPPLCVCGTPIEDGPFRFCTVCRQVDLSTIRAGGF